jgi:hypothetical protein
MKDSRSRSTPILGWFRLNGECQSAGNELKPRRGRKWRVAGIGLLSLGVIVMVTPAGTVLSQVGPGSEEVPSGPTLDPDSQGLQGGGPPEPRLSQEQEAEAKDAIASDPVTKSVLERSQYQVQDIGPWVTGGSPESAEQIVGAIALLTLDQPTSFEMRAWPAIHQQADGSSYRQDTLHFAASPTTEMMVLVDFRQDRVVQLEPFGVDVQITPEGGYPEDVPQAKASSGE